MANNSEKIVKLPFFETIRRSFLFVLVNFKDFAKLTLPAFAIMIYEMSTNFQSICSIKPTGCEDSLSNKCSLLLLGVVSIALAVVYCRRIILKDVGDFWTLASFRRIVSYFLYNIFLLFMIALPSYLLIVVLSLLLSSVTLPENVGYLLLLIPFGLTMFLSRFFLVFPAVTVDDKALKLKESFYMTKGNVNRIFWGQIVMMLPGMVLLMILSNAYNIAASSSYVTNFIFTLLFVALSFFDTCLKSSFYAHIYQYFTFYNKSEEE